MAKTKKKVPQHVKDLEKQVENTFTWAHGKLDDLEQRVAKLERFQRRVKLDLASWLTLD